MQECKLTTAQVVDTYHLDDKPGYKIGEDNRAECADTTTQIKTFTKCEHAKASLDWKATDVTSITDVSFPKGCFRTKTDGYRFQHNESSYLWYFNNVNSGQADPKSQSVCQGNGLQRGFLFA